MINGISKNLLKAFVASTLAVAVFGCGKTKNAVDKVAGNLENPELIHRWEQEKCTSYGLPGTSIGLSFREAYDFGNPGVKKIRQYYSSKNCIDIAYEVKYEGDYKKQTEIRPDVYQIDLNFKTVSVTVLNDKGKDLLNTVSFCNINTWEVNLSRDLTGSERGLTCDLDTLPQNIYDVYTINNQILYLGQGTQSTKSAAEHRPAEVDSEAGYRQL